jgi:hypothetical protein
VIPSHVLVEFGSLLRSFVARRSLTSRDASEIFFSVDAMAALNYWDDTVAARAMQVATRLGQSDTFDSTGYAIAERLGAEFRVWTGASPMPPQPLSCPASASSPDSRKGPDFPAPFVDGGRLSPAARATSAR